MNLYEIDIESRWYIAADDENQALQLFREELFASDMSDEDVDQAMEDLVLRELTSQEAKSLGYEDIELGEVSVWDLFQQMGDVGLVHTDHNMYED